MSALTMPKSALKRLPDWAGLQGLIRWTALAMVVFSQPQWLIWAIWVTLAIRV
jgi:cytochrome c oxidase subunit IV